MTALKIIFWMLFFIVFYAYIGYGIILYTLVLIKRVLRKSGKKVADHSYEPDVTLLFTYKTEFSEFLAKIPTPFADEPISVIPTGSLYTPDCAAVVPTSKLP